MSTEVTIHGCTGIRVESCLPETSNYIKLIIMREEEGETLELAMFGFPEDVTHNLMLAFSDVNTRIDKVVEDTIDAALEKNK